MNWTERRERLRAIVAGPRCIFPASVYDGISARIAGELGFTPSRDLTTGLKQTIDWYIAEEGWWRAVRTGAYREWIKSHYGRTD